VQTLSSAREDARPPLKSLPLFPHLGGERPREPVPVEDVLHEPQGEGGGVGVGGDCRRQTLVWSAASSRRFDCRDLARRGG